MAERARRERSDPRQPLPVAVVGTGAMGRNHVRILAELATSELVGVFDPDTEAAQAVAARHGARVLGSLAEVAEVAEAVVVAAPTQAHAALGVPLLERGLHVLVEKPMAQSLEEADALLAAAERGAAAGDGTAPVLRVGHVEFFNPAVQALLAAGRRPRFVEAQRLSRFSPRSLDVDVVLDLMIHDLQILHALDPSEVREIRATGIDVLSPRIDICNARLELASGAVANLTASRVSSDSVRKLRAFAAESYYSLDYREQEVKGYGLDDAEDERRIRPLEIAVERREPLLVELESFVASCRGRRAPGVDGAQGRRALATALAVRDAILEKA